MEREFGSALASDGERPDDQMLRKAAFDAVRFFEGSLFAKTHAFPLPDVISRFVIGTQLANLRRKAVLDDPERDFVVRAIDILQRNVLHSRGDELYLMSGMNSEKERRLAHSWLLLSDRRNELEIRGLASNALATWAADGGTSGQTPPKNGIDGTLFRQRALLIEIDKQLAELSDSFGNSDSNGSADAELPGWNSLEALMSDNEVVVSEAPFLESAYKVCVGPHREFVFESTPIEPTLASDLKILRASLTATYAPSKELDRQYPAEAALRTRNFVLGGLDRCVGHAQRIIYNPMMDFADIPLPALLDEIPPRMGDGYDLSHAAWLLNKFQFSNVSSVEEFVAARRLSKVAGGEFPFLGIGDPLLSRPPIDAKTVEELPASQGAATADGSISTLPELPETAEELRSIAAIIPGSTLLLRSDATEDKVFRQPLGHFNIIEFATHGLVTGDLDGISEPGLVLTPASRSETTPFHDGFLSSTELSKLDLRAKLVVLSACNTANFDVDRFAGSIRGLTSALAESGVPTVLASLWPVESQTGKTIMSNFYGQLLHGPDRTVSGAFSNAIKSFLHTTHAIAYLHPRFWAPFTVYGDGGETIDRPSLGQADQLKFFEVSQDLGEIYGLARSGNRNSYYVSRAGAWDGKRFAAVVEKRGSTGVVDWQVKDRTIGAGPIAIGASQIYVAGYVANADGVLATPVIRSFDLNGRLLWKKTFDQEGAQSFAADIGVSPSGTIWALIDSDFHAGKPDHAYALRVVALDARGRNLGSWNISGPKDYRSFRRPTMVVDGKGATVFVPSRSHTGQLIDDFGNLQNCLSDDGSDVIRIVAGSRSLSEIGSLPGVVVMRAHNIKNRLYVAGIKLGACRVAGEPFFGRINIPAFRVAQSGLPNTVGSDELYFEKGFENGQFVDFVEHRGKVVLTGYNVSRTAELKLFDPQTNDFAKGATSEFQRVDSFFVDLDINRSPQSAQIHFIDAGVDLFANALVANDNEVLLAGSVGFPPYGPITGRNEFVGVFCAEVELRVAHRATSWCGPRSFAVRLAKSNLSRYCSLSRSGIFRTEDSFVNPLRPITPAPRNPRSAKAREHI